MKAKGKDLDSIRIDRHASRRARLGLAVCLLSGATAMAATAYESPPTLRASELAKGSLLKGPGHRVDEQVARPYLVQHAGQREARIVDLLAV